MDFVRLAEFLSQLPARTAMFWVAILGALIVPGWFGVILLPNALATVADRFMTAAAFGLLSLLIGITFAFLVVDEFLDKKQTDGVANQETKQTLIVMTATVGALVIPLIMLAGMVTMNSMRAKSLGLPTLGLGSYFMAIMLFATLNASRYIWNTRHRRKRKISIETDMPSSHSS